MRVLELNVSTKFVLMEQVAINVSSANPRYLPAVAKSTNAFELQISSHELSKIIKDFVPLFLNESVNSENTTGTNSNFLTSFCMTSETGKDC